MRCKFNVDLENFDLYTYMLRAGAFLQYFIGFSANYACAIYRFKLWDR